MDFSLLKQEDFLFDKNSRVPDEELHGDEKVLLSPLVEGAFQKIYTDYYPKHKNVIFSLCTTTRPYIYSTKWSVIDECFGDKCDMIVCSNGGIIPLEYMNCYPFLSYNAPHDLTGKTDDLYMEVFERRLTQFFSKNSWENCFFIFAPGSRNYRSIQKLISKYDNWYLIPDEETYKKSINGELPKLGFAHKVFGVISEPVFKFIEDKVGYSENFHNRLKKFNKKPKTLF